MPESKEKKEVVKKAAVSREEFDALAGKVRRMAANWKKFCGIHVGLTDDGKIQGSARVGLAALILVAVVSIAVGTTVQWRCISPGDSTAKGTCKVETDDAGTATLTVDAIVGDITGDVTGDVTGDLTGDDINMSGSVSDTLGFNVTKAVTVTGLTATVNFGNVTSTDNVMDDTDYVQYKLLTGNNSTTESVDWAYCNVVIDDNTTNTEDAAFEVYIQVGGTATKAADFNASGLAVTALNTGTGEATVDGKYSVVGGDATTALMIQKAAITSTAAGPQTNSFAVVFGAAPTVVCTYTEDPGDVQPLYVTDVTPSNFVCTVTADKNFAYIAVGTRP